MHLFRTFVSEHLGLGCYKQIVRTIVWANGHEAGKNLEIANQRSSDTSSRKPRRSGQFTAF
jgi:predicted NUDIX family NTP pyrophosphohydrolase